MAVREVTVLAAGGTIAMAGADGAVPELDAGALSSPRCRSSPASPGLRARTLGGWPGVHVEPADALAIARAAVAEAAGGRGVVVTHGTDTLEETAVLCDLLHGGDAPIVLTGAIRPASATGADGPANLLDAVRAAGAASTAGLGALVCFGGELHAARAVRKTDSVSPRAFSSPRTGPLGRVAEASVEVWGAAARRPPLPVAQLDARVEIVPAALGADGAMLDAAIGAGADGLVVVLLGAGHAPPAFLDGLPARGARRAGRGLRAARARADPARHLRLRRRGARRARRRADLRAGALPRRGADHADGLPRRRPLAGRDGSGLRRRRPVSRA